AASAAASFTSDFILNQSHPDATLQFWLKPPAVTGEQDIFWTTSNNDAAGGADADTRFNLSIYPGSDPGSVTLSMDYRAANNYGDLHRLIPTGLSLPVNQWSLVTITRSNGAAYSYYVNGSLVSTYTDSNPALPTANSAGNPWTLGGRQIAGDNYTGLIDEIAFDDAADPPNQVTAQFNQAAETVNESAGTFSIPVTLSAAQSVAVSIPFTLGGSATAGTDYSGVAASPLVIPAGQTSGVITGALLSDPGPDQTLTITLGAPSAATLGSTTVNTLTITEPAAAAPPTVTAVSPATGPTAGGTTVTITGTNLAGATEVDFGSSKVTSFMSDTATSIVLTSPVGAAVPVDVQVITSAGPSALSSADQFTYTAAPPTVGVSTVTSFNGTN